MHLLNQIHPTKEQFNELMTNYPKDKPVTMLNIIKYKTETSTGASSETVYNRYAANLLKFVHRAGAQLIWKGKVRHTLIGDGQNHPDTVFLVKWNKLQDFLDMIMDQEYRKISRGAEGAEQEINKFNLQSTYANFMFIFGKENASDNFYLVSPIRFGFIFAIS